MLTSADSIPPTRGRRRHSTAATDVPALLPGKADGRTPGARRWLRAGVAHERCLRSGAAAETILELARERRCAAIVVGTRGLGAVAGLVLGSVAGKIVQLAPVPVTLVK